MKNITDNPLFTGSNVSMDDLTLVRRLDLDTFQDPHVFLNAVRKAVATLRSGRRGERTVKGFVKTYNYEEILKQGEKRDNLFALYLDRRDNLHWRWEPRKVQAPASKAVH